MAKRKVYTPEGRVYEQSRGAQGKPPPAPANKPYTPRWTGGTSGSTQPFWKQPQFRQTVRPPAQPTAPEPEPDRGWFGNLLHRAGDVFKTMVGISSPAAGPIQAAKQMGLVENPPMTTIQVRDIYGKQTPVDISGGKNNRDRLFFGASVAFNSLGNFISSVGSQSGLGKIGKGTWSALESAYFASPMRKALDDWNMVTHMGQGGVYLNSKGEVVPPNRIQEVEASGEKLRKVSYHEYSQMQRDQLARTSQEYFRSAFEQTEPTSYTVAKRYGWEHSDIYEQSRNIKDQRTRNVIEAAEQGRARQFLVERSDTLTARAFQTAEAGDLDAARALRREAIQLERGAGSDVAGGLYDPYFSYTWITNPEREQAFIDATIDAELQLGRELTPFEIWKMRDVYVDPWRELAGEAVFDWTNFLGGWWDDALRLAAKPFSWTARKAGTTLTHLGGPIGDTARWISKRAVRSQAGKLAHSANDVLVGIAHAAKRVGAGEVGYEEFLRSLGQVADAVKTGIGQPGRLGGLPPEFGSRQEREILGMANAFGSDPELARRLGPDGWANMAEDARRDVYQQAYDRILAAEQRKVTQYEDLAYQDLVRRKVAGTEDELREQARTLAQEQIIEKAGREAAAVAYDPANLVSHMSAQFKRGYLEVHAGDMRLPGLLGSIQRFNEKFMGGWTRAVLSARPAWVIRNYMDNTFRALIFGVNPFADIGTLAGRYTDDTIAAMLREAGLMPTELATSFGRSEAGFARVVDEVKDGVKTKRVIHELPSMYQRLEGGERPRWIGDLVTSAWRQAKEEGADGKIKGLAARVYDTLTNSITDWNALVEFSFKVRMFDQQFYKNFYQLNGQAWQYVTRVLRERGASDADIALAQRIWNAARTNPSKANEMLKGLQMSDNSLVRAAMLMPPDLDNMLSRMPVEARAGLIDSVSRQLEDAMEAARLAGKEVGEAEIRKFFDDLLTDFRAQQAKIVNKPDLRDAPGTPKVGAEPEFDETLPANPPGEVAPGLHEVHHPAREASEALATATDGTKVASYLRDCVSERYVVVTGTVDGKPYDIQVVDGRVTITLSPNALTGKPKQVRSTLQNALRDAIIAEDNLITKADFDQFLKNPAKLKADKPDAYQRIAARMDNDPDLRKTLASLRGERSLSYTSLLDETGDAAETQINQLVKEGATREEAVRSLRKPEVYTSGDRQGVAMARARDLEDSLPTSDPRRGILTTYLTRYESVRNLLESWTLHVWPNPLGASDYGIRSRRWDLRDEIIVSMYNKMADDLDWTVAHLDNLTQEDAIPSLSQFVHDMGFGFEFRKDGTLRKILYFPPGSKRPMPQSNWAVDAFIHHFFGKNQTNTGDMRRLIMETPYTRQLQYNGATSLPPVDVPPVVVEEAVEQVVKTVDAAPAPPDDVLRGKIQEQMGITLDPTGTKKMVDRRKDPTLRALVDKIKRGEGLTAEESKAFMDRAFVQATGLPNKIYFEFVVSGSAQELPYKAMIDLDFLKWFNDTGGHAIGDDLLQAFADDLKAVAGDNNAFHFSGDEFAAQFQDAASAEKAMQELQQRFAAREFVFKELTKDGKETGQQVTARNLSFGWGGGDTIESADKVLVARKKTARSTRGSEPSGTTRGPAEAGLAGRQGGAEWVDLTPEELAAIDKIRQENILHLNKEEIREVRARTGLNVDAQGQIDGQFATPEQMAEIQKVQQLVTKRTAIRNSWQQPVTKLTDPKAQAMLQSEAQEMLLDVFHLEGMDGRPAAFKDVLEGVSWGKAIAKHLPEEDARQAFVTAMGKVMRGEADNSDLAKAIRKALAQNVEQGVTGKVERLAHPYAYTALEYTPEQTTDLLDRWSTALRRNPMEELEGMTAAQQNRAALWDAFTQSVWTGDRTIQQSWGQYANSPELLTAKLRDMLERLPEGTSPEAIESIQMLLFQVQNFHAISNNMAGFLGLQRSLRNSADEILPLMPSPARMPENYQQFFAAGDESLKQIAQIEDALKHWSEYAQGQAKAGTWAAVDPQTARILAGSADDVSRILQSTINLAKHGPEPDLRAQIDEVVGAIVNKNMTHKRVGREWVPLTAQEKASIKRVTENWGKYQEFLQQFTNVPEGALPRTNRFMIDYSDFSQLDEVIKQFVPFWTFSSRSFPFWAETMATHPQIISFYNKYIAHNRRIQYQEGLYTSTGSPMPSLEGYVRIPGTEIWFNPLAPFSFRYVLMPFTKQYSQEYEADSIMNQIMMWAYDYSMLYGVSLSPWLTVPAGFFGWFGDNPVSGVVPQVNLMPPWWREGIRQGLNKIGGTQAVHLGNAIIGSDAPWKDYMVERRLMADAYERMQRARTDAEKLEIAMEISTILQLKDRSQSDLWNKTLREMDMSELGRAWGGYMTGIYSKEFTDAEAEFQRIRDDLNFYRDMINNEVGAEIFALDPSAENRYELYKDKVYNTPEGFLAGLYNIIRWTRTPEGEQLYGQERREYVSKEILESEVTSAYYDTLNALRQSYQDKLAQLPIGAESKLKQALWEEYYAKRAEIEQMPEYELARRGWSEGYKPAEMLYEHYQSLWWQMLQETKPQWDRTNESWDEYLLKEQEWLADLPQNAAALSSTWNEILAKDLKTEDLDKVMAEGKSLPGGRTMNVSEIVKRLQKETSAEGYLAWKRSRDSALDAMDEAWKELYWNPYWENLKGLKGYERDLAEAEWLEANPVPTAAQLAAWVKQTYGDQFQLNELLLAAQGRSVESVTERQAPENDTERMEQQIWDILAMAGPNKKALQNAYEALGGYWSDISTFYNVGGNGAAWSDPEKFQAMYDKLVQAASNLGLREPSPQLLREWTEAQALDKNLDVVITTQLGDDIMEVMADYWNADSATRRQMRKADPRIDMYYKLRDLYAEQYPLWAKYYLQASSTSGGSSGGSGKSYSGGGGGRYYSRGGGGSGSRRSGGSSSGYSTGGAPRIGMGYRSSLDAARLLDPSAVGRGGTAGQVRLPPLPAPSVLQPALPPDMVTRPLEPEPTEKPPIPPPDLPLF